jgi:hypothetical protein
MPRKSKFFRVAVEGVTTDGRKIERSWLQEIAQTYSREKYGARIFIEHIRGLNPQYGFRAMGDVLAVKTEEVEIDGQKRLALFAQIEPTEEMVAMVKAGQKIYSSIEVNPDFAGSGKAYLMGLGITDSPASLGTDVLAFAAQNPETSPFKSRKQQPDNVFSAAELSEIELEDEQAGPSLLERITAMFSRKQTSDDARFSDVHSAVEEVATHVTQQLDDVEQRFSKLHGDYAALQTKVDTAIADLSKKIDHTPNSDPKRPVAPGGTGTVLTDC